VDQLQKLLKIFKTWEVLNLFPEHIMNPIADSIQLRPMELQLLTPD